MCRDENREVPTGWMEKTLHHHAAPLLSRHHLITTTCAICRIPVSSYASRAEMAFDTCMPSAVLLQRTRPRKFVSLGGRDGCTVAVMPNALRLVEVVSRVIQLILLLSTTENLLIQRIAVPSFVSISRDTLEVNFQCCSPFIDNGLPTSIYEARVVWRVS